MKKRLLSLALALTLCLGLTVPVLAAEENTITDEAGYVYTLSKPLVGTDTLETGMHYLDDNYQQIATNVKVYLIEEGTVITPKDPVGTPKTDGSYGTTYYLTDEEGRKEAGVSNGEDYTVEDFSVDYCAMYGIYDGENGVDGRDGLWMLEPLGALDGVTQDEEPTQPLKADEFQGIYVLSRTISWSQIYGHNGSGVYTESYAYVKVLTAAEAAKLRAEQKPSEPDTPSTPSTPGVTVDPIPASGTSYASTQTVTVDGKAVEFQMYALKDAKGNPTNYIKLRDLAQILNGTKAQFAVGYDNAAKAISVTTGTAYTPNGSEMQTPFSGDRAYTGGLRSVSVNGAAVELTAITLTDDAGGGYTYFKLRDLGKALGFNTGWTREQGVFIESDKPYAE